MPAIVPVVSRVLVLVLPAMLTGCAGSPVVNRPPEPTVVTSRLSGFTQDVPGTALRFDMIAINDVPPEVGDPFWMARTEATWDLYDLFVFRLDEHERTPDADVAAVTRPSKPYIAMDRNFGHAGYPAISVNLEGAVQFCRWLSAKTKRHYRLPTEAEWTWVCEQSGLDTASADAFAWHHGNAEYTTHPVASKAPDANGLHDLWGNASEWCIAAPGEGITLGGTYKDGIDAIGCDRRVPYSDAWNASDPQFPKSRWWLADGGFVGFRVVCDPDPVGDAHVAGAAP